jgi:hypothetical protein
VTQQDEDDKSKGAGCRCGRTKCLKLYCHCFKNNIGCLPACNCTDCHNDGKHEEERIDAIRGIRMNNPNAFKGTDLELENQQVMTASGSMKVVHGCRCKRSRCVQKYCECYGAGIKCTTNCICSECQNGNNGGKLKSVAKIMRGNGPAQAQISTGPVTILAGRDMRAFAFLFAVCMLLPRLPIH